MTKICDVCFGRPPRYPTKIRCKTCGGLGRDKPVRGCGTRSTCYRCQGKGYQIIESEAWCPKCRGLGVIY